MQSQHCAGNKETIDEQSIYHPHILLQQHRSSVPVFSPAHASIPSYPSSQVHSICQQTQQSKAWGTREGARQQGGPRGKRLTSSSSSRPSVSLTSGEMKSSSISTFSMLLTSVRCFRMVWHILTAMSCGHHKQHDKPAMDSAASIPTPCEASLQ